MSLLLLVPVCHSSISTDPSFVPCRFVNRCSIFEGQCASFVVLKFSKHASAAVACSAASIGIEGRFLDSWSKAHSRDRRAALQSHLRHWILAFCEVNGGCLGDLPAEAFRESNGIISEDLYIE